MPVIFYEGKRIYFRPIEPADEPLLRRWINDPRVWSTLGHRRPFNEPREREWIENYGKSETDYVFGIVVKQDHRLIGTTGLHQIDLVSRRAVFGIIIGELEFQNHGYGTEATQLTVRFGFEVLNLHRIELLVFDHNPRAIRVYEKVGFVLEGRQRQASYVSGQYRDVLRYGLLRAEWQADRPSRHATPHTAAAEMEPADGPHDPRS